MDPSTITPTTFVVTGPGATPVTGKVSYDTTTHIATFTPASALAAGTIFDATITTDAKDLAGNALANNFGWSFTTGSTAGVSPLDLGAATGFAVLAQATVTNTGATVVNGDLGLSPGSSVTGFPPGTMNGIIQIDNAPAVAGIASLMTAYGDALAVPAGTGVVGRSGRTSPSPWRLHRCDLACDNVRKSHSRCPRRHERGLDLPNRFNPRDH